MNDYKKIVIVGAGRFGLEVLEILKKQNEIRGQWEILGFIAEREFISSDRIENYPVLGDLDWFKNNKDVGCVIALGDPKIRKRIAKYLESGGTIFYNAIHPSAIISNFVNMGKDVIICAGSFVSVHAIIKDHIIVNAHSIIAHDVIVENYASIMTSVTTSGNDHIGEGVFIGAGATIIPKITVGE